MRSNFKKSVLVTMSLAVCLVMLSGCGKGNEPKVSANETKAAENKTKATFVLKFAHHDPQTAFVVTQGMVPWSKIIEDRTGGRVKIDHYPASMLGKPQDAYDNVIKGVADISWGYIAFMPGRFPMSEVVNLPMLGIDKATLGSHVIWDLYQNTPYLKKEFSDVHVLMLHTHDGAPVISKKPIKTSGDMVGKKLRSPGGPLIPMLKSLGASPMSMSPAETYQAAEKGVIDGAVLAWEAIEMMSMQDVLKYAVDANAATGVFFLVMNKKVWESLPPDVQNVFNEESGEKASQLFAKYGWDETKRITLEKFAKAGGTLIPFTPEEKTKWTEKAKVVWDAWVDDAEKKQLPGKAVLEETRKLIQTYEGK